MLRFGVLGAGNPLYLLPGLYWREGGGRRSLGQESASQERLLLRRELLGKADVEVDEEVTSAPGVLEQRHPLPRHHFAVRGAAKGRTELGGAAGPSSPTAEPPHPRTLPSGFLRARLLLQLQAEACLVSPGSSGLPPTHTKPSPRRSARGGHPPPPGWFPPSPTAPGKALEHQNRANSGNGDALGKRRALTGEQRANAEFPPKCPVRLLGHRAGPAAACPTALTPRCR